MSLPLFANPTAAEALLRRVPLDEVVVPEAMQERLATTFGERLSPAAAVDRIIADVRQRGDAALREWTLRLDRCELAAIEVPSEAIAAAVAACDPALLAAMELAAGEIERFHRQQTRQSWIDVGKEGLLGQLVVPLERVGVYVPGGAAPLPSTLLMAAVPARVAGVDEVIVCSPPQAATGLPAAEVLVAARVAGVHRVFALGGAQAIAAMAYGSASVPGVDKIVGPGNLFVVLAKRAVYGVVGIESLAGPTETMVIADAAANPVLVAADLLAQAEHVLASAMLLTPSRALAVAVQAEASRQLAALPEPNRSAAGEALATRSGVVLVADLDEAFAVANRYGPEHLCLLLTDPTHYIGKVRNAGGIFLGERSFEVLGDYVAGPSHIMPTGGTARYASPLNVDDFRKLVSLIGLNERALRRIGPAAQRLARAEGLIAHANAVAARLPPAVAESETTGYNE